MTSMPFCRTMLEGRALCQVECTLDWDHPTPQFGSYVTALALFNWLLPFILAVWSYRKVHPLQQFECIDFLILCNPCSGSLFVSFPCLNPSILTQPCELAHDSQLFFSNVLTNQPFVQVYLYLKRHNFTQHPDWAPKGHAGKMMLASTSLTFGTYSMYGMLCFASVFLGPNSINPKVRVLGGVRRMNHERLLMLTVFSRWRWSHR